MPLYNPLFASVFLCQDVYLFLYISISALLILSWWVPALYFYRHSAHATEINRILERCLKESRAIDTESLCIIAGQKVVDN